MHQSKYFQQQQQRRKLLNLITLTSSFSGMPYLIRKALLLFSPTVEVSKQGDSIETAEWHIQFHEAMKTIELKFKFGEEFTETLPMSTHQVI